MRSTHHKVLIVDDDPSHLEIYGLLLKQAGFEPFFALVRFAGAEFPREPDIRGILLDSRLNSMKSCPELARQIRMRYPQAPILLLADVHGAADDLAPYVADCVRRGEPGKLLDKLSVLVGRSTRQARTTHKRPLVPAFR